MLWEYWEDIYFEVEELIDDYLVGLKVGILRTENGDLVLGHFDLDSLTPATGYFIKFFYKEDFIGILRKVHIRGF